MAGTAPPPLAQRRGRGGGDAGRGAGVLGAPDQRLGAGRVFQRGAFGQRPARPGTAQRAGAARRGAVPSRGEPSAGGAGQPGAGTGQLCDGCGRQAPAPARGGRGPAGGGLDRAGADARAWRDGGPSGRAGAGHRVPEPGGGDGPGACKPARQGWRGVAPAKRTDPAQRDGGWHRERGRRAAGGHGHWRGARPVWGGWAAQPHRPAPATGHGSRGVHRLAAIAPGCDGGRARRRRRADQQPVARVPGQPDGAGAGGAVHWRVPGVLGAVAQRGAPRATVCAARRARPHSARAAVAGPGGVVAAWA